MDRETFLASGAAALVSSHLGTLGRATAVRPRSVPAAVSAAFIPPWVLAHPLMGEMRRFDGAVAPRGWMFCEGQLLRIKDYPKLFATLGRSCGGDGKTTFALPRSRAGRYIIAVTGAFGLRPQVIAAMRRAPLEARALSTPPRASWEAQRKPARRLVDKTPLWWPGTVPTRKQLSDQQRSMRTRLTPEMLTPHYFGAPRAR